MDNKIKLLDEIIKEMYPDAVCVSIFVNYQEIEVVPRYITELDGISMKTLSGKWVKPNIKERIM